MRIAVVFATALVGVITTISAHTTLMAAARRCDNRVRWRQDCTERPPSWTGDRSSRLAQHGTDILRRRRGSVYRSSVQVSAVRHVAAHHRFAERRKPFLAGPMPFWLATPVVCRGGAGAAAWRAARRARRA